MRHCLLVIVLMSGFAEVGAVESGYRFQALMDLDRNAQTGCALQTAAGLLQGKEARVYALTDRIRVNAVMHEVCRDGRWHEVERSVPQPSTAFAEGALGSDAIEWSVPLNGFGQQTELPIQMLAERTTSLAFDVVGNGAAFSTLNVRLAAGDAAPIPALGLVGVLLLGAALLICGQRTLALRAIGRKALALVGLLMLMQSPTSPVASTVAANAASLAIAEDPANDVLHADAGVDVLRVVASAGSERLHLRVEVNNIDNDALADGAKVLFLGNSLTYSNDLPLIVKAIARQAGKSLTVASVTQGGANLEDLYRQTNALAEIARGRYALVILQQGPSSLLESQQDLRLWAGRFEEPIRDSGARPALYMVWPDETRLAFFDAVRTSYLNAALDVDGMFIPAGETWQSAWRAEPGMPLYGSDRFHPSATGSYAAALSIFSEFYRQSPVGLPATVTLDNGRVLRFSDAVARVLQTSAWSAHLEYGLPGH